MNTNSETTDRSTTGERRCAIVTGAGGPIGDAIASSMSDAGWDVLRCDLSVPNHPSSQWWSQLNVTDSAAWKTTIEKAADAHGTIHALICAAGVMTQGEDVVDSIDPDEWKRVLDVNLTGVFLGMKHAIPHMRRNKTGRIINISSASATRGIPGQFAYSVSKAGLVGLTHQTAAELGTTGITVNAVSPGLMEAPMGGRVSKPERGEFLDRQPTQRPVTPDEIAHAVNYLLSDSARSVTGSVLSVDGGWTVSSV